MIDSNFLSILALIAVVLGGLGAILGGTSVILHAIAPRTKTQLDDRAAAGVDAAHAKLDQVLGLLRGIVPSASSAPNSTASTLLPILMLAGIAVGVEGCSTISSGVKAFESGAVACAKADSAQAKALGLQLGIDALAGLLAGQDAETVWAKVAADAEAGAKSQGIAVGACAFDGVIADVEKILHPTTPGTATSALVVATAVDPLAAGRAALAAFERAHGVTSVVR